jgi:hypothetical protein
MRMRRKTRSREVRIEGAREGARGTKEERTGISVSIRRIEDEKDEERWIHPF